MSYPAFHGVSQMAMYACPSLRNCANQGMYPPAVSNRPPKETASVPTSVGQLFGIITPCSWVMSVTSCAVRMVEGQRRRPKHPVDARLGPTLAQWHPFA